MADNTFTGDTENPFADPSVADMTSGASRGLGDFNPFAEQDQTISKSATTTPVAPPPAPMPQSQPAVLEPRQEPPPYVVSDEQELLRKRQEDLEKKAAELQRKEQELQRMQYSGYRENNFPPLPKWCKKCRPCFYHDIQVDIPVEYQKTCRFLFLRWQAYSFVMFYNFLSAMAFLIMGAEPVNDGETFGLSILFVIANIPLSFLCWYRPAYKALKNDSSFSYVVFFLIYFLHIGLNIFYCLGVPGSGACGFINATQASHNNKAVAIMMFVCGALLLAGVIIDILLLLRMHRIYRLAGASFEKAQGEFAKGVATNPHVQNAAASGVRAAMENQK